MRHVGTDECDEVRKCVRGGLARVPTWTAVAGAAFLLVFLSASSAAAQETPVHATLGAALPGASVAPFALLLLGIAVLPLLVPHWWELNLNKAIVSLTLGCGFAAWLVHTHHDEGIEKLADTLRDYVSFIVLLGTLFVISGGVHVRGSLAGTPLSNTLLLSIGAVLANLVGTTGASMLLIRPLLRANLKRVRKAHLVVFFIFIVSNCGGMLTPLGDPPLFLGFLNGVPFEWTLRLWKEWLFANGILLIVFHIYDEAIFDREERERPGSQLEEVMEHEPIRIEGRHNVLFLVGVILVIVGKGQGWGTHGKGWPFGVQEGLMAALAAGSYAGTRRETRAANRFTWGPILEVGILFAGIFATMIAPLEILNHLGRSHRLTIDAPWQFYWASGGLSSFLDNAPTYLTFAAAAAGKAGVSNDAPQYLAQFLSQGAGAEALLTAVACGSVMMGANTYIGNGPNFMVKAIAEENGVKMPSFFGYMAYSGMILIPIFLLVTLLFFR